MTSAPSGSASAKRYPFPKSSRILKRPWFNKIHAEGARRGNPFFSVISLSDPAFLCAQAGLVTSRKLGGAVVRNRLRRRMREAIRHEIHLAPAGWGFVFHPRHSAADAPLDQLRAEVARVFARCAR